LNTSRNIVKLLACNFRKLGTLIAFYMHYASLKISETLEHNIGLIGSVAQINSTYIIYAIKKHPSLNLPISIAHGIWAHNELQHKDPKPYTSVFSDDWLVARYSGAI
jgi:hypothetical protein